MLYTSRDWFSGEHRHVRADDYIWLSPNQNSTGNNIRIGRSQLRLATHTATWIDPLTCACLSRHVDEYIFADHSGYYAHLLPADDGGSSDGSGAEVLIQRIPAVTAWLETWKSKVSRGNYFDSSVAVEGLPDINMTVLAAAISAMARSTARSITVGDMHGGRAELIVPASSQLRVPQTTTESDDYETILAIAETEELITHAGNSNYVPSSRVAQGVKPESRVRLTDMRRAAGPPWRFADSCKKRKTS